MKHFLLLKQPGLPDKSPRLYIDPGAIIAIETRGTGDTAVVQAVNIHLISGVAVEVLEKPDIILNAIDRAREAVAPAAALRFAHPMQ